MTVAKDLRKGHYNGIVDIPSPDTGCRLHPSCLACPRPMCIYDEDVIPFAAVNTARKERRTAIVTSVKERGRGYGAVKATAQEFGVSPSTVWNALRKEIKDA
jgi:hypothetical protein